MTGNEVLHNIVTTKLVRLTEIELNKSHSKFRTSDISLMHFLFVMVWHKEILTATDFSFSLV